MNSNEPRPNPFTETLPTALPYLPRQSRPVGQPVPSEGKPIIVEQSGVASHRPLETKTTGRPSRTRITIAFFTLGPSIPFTGIRRKHTTEYSK